MSDIQSHYDEHYRELIDKVTDQIDPSTDAATKAIKNLQVFSTCRPPAPEPQPEPTVVPTTRWGKVRAQVACALDNETTRTLIKAGGAFGGVFLVTWSTVHRDRVLERQALAQANQRPS